MLLGILYKSPDELDFVKHINVFTEFEVLDKQECYLLRDLNINLILEETEICSNKVIEQMTKTCRLYRRII